MPTRQASHVVLAVLLLGACGIHFATLADKEGLAKQRAAFDLSCGQSDLQATHLDQDERSPTFGVKGCGKQSTYIVSCDGDGTALANCKAIKNDTTTK